MTSSKCSSLLMSSSKETKIQGCWLHHRAACVSAAINFKLKSSKIQAEVPGERRYYLTLERAASFDTSLIHVHRLCNEQAVNLKNDGIYCWTRCILHGRVVKVGNIVADTARAFLEYMMFHPNVLRPHSNASERIADASECEYSDKN